MLVVVTVVESTCNPVGPWGGLGGSLHFSDTEC